jgi:hypothetical protein
MYDKTPKKDWLTAAVTAALGAGVVTTFAISQGQHPLLAIGITSFATVAALLVEQYIQFSK